MGVAAGWTLLCDQDKGTCWRRNRTCSTNYYSNQQELPVIITMQTLIDNGHAYRYNPSNLKQVIYGEEVPVIIGSSVCAISVCLTGQ